MRIGTTLFIVIAIIIAAAVLLPRTPVVTSPTLIASVSYVCDGDKAVFAAYYQGENKPPASPDQPPVPGGSVALTFSDGRAMTLPQTLSADGMRYANTDESLIFWSRGNGALELERGEERSYTGCIAAAPEPSGQSLPQVYATSTSGFSIRLAGGYTINEAYRYQELGPGKSIRGVKFTIPKATASSTNLSAGSYLSVEQIASTTDCRATLFLDHATAREVTEASTTYSVASSTSAAAGNRYEETVYALSGTSPCVAVRYFIHYSAFENYPVGAVREFDKAMLLAQFDAIRRTLTLAQH